MLHLMVLYLSWSHMSNTPPRRRCHRPSQCLTVNIVNCQFRGHRPSLKRTSGKFGCQHGGPIDWSCVTCSLRLVPIPAPGSCYWIDFKGFFPCCNRWSIWLHIRTNPWQRIKPLRVKQIRWIWLVCLKLQLQVCIKTHAVSAVSTQWDVLGYCPGSVYRT